MNFQTVEYIDWFRVNWHDIECDLATSGMHSVNLTDLGISLEDLNMGHTLFFGLPRLVELVSQIYGVDKEEVLITSGSTHANFLMCNLLLNEGDEVIIEHPVYTPLLDLVKAFNPKIKTIERKFEEGYTFNVDRLSEMATKDTRMLVLTNLHNPSGAAMDEATFKAIAEIADDFNIHVLSDEVYRDFMAEEAPPVFSSFSELGISTCSVSKFYGSGALRAGWAMCHPNLIEKARKLNDNILAANSSAGEELGALILEKREWFLEKIKKITSNNLPIVKKWIKERNDLEWVAPNYGVIGFPKLRNGCDSMKLAELLLEKYRTLISPGRFFGCEGNFRLGFGGDEEMLRKGLENLGLALDEFN